MPLKTWRVDETAEVRIDVERCTGCGQCVRVCRGAPLFLEEGRVRVDHSRIYGCIGCGQCMAICPTGAIRIQGREMSPERVVPLPDKESCADYHQLYNLLLARRSVREFQQRPVEREKIELIVKAAATAPMGVPPTDVGITIFDNEEAIAEFRKDLLASLRGVRWFFSPWMMGVMRLFSGKKSTEIFRSFVDPLTKVYLDDQGPDWFLYDAPLAMLFYTAPTSDPVDPCIPATYAMLAAESLGLGSCMLGSPAFMLKYRKHLKAKYCGYPEALPGLVVIFGYPDVQYRHALSRDLANVHNFTPTKNTSAK